MSFYSCDRCKEVFDERDAPTHTEREKSEAWGTVAWTEREVLSCPSCGHGEELEELTTCVECEKEPAVEGDDLCVACLRIENDRREDIEIETIEIPTREQRQKELRAALIDVALSPWKKQA